MDVSPDLVERWPRLVAKSGVVHKGGYATPDTFTCVRMLEMELQGITNPAASNGVEAPGCKSGTKCSIVSSELLWLSNAATRMVKCTGTVLSFSAVPTT